MRAAAAFLAALPEAKWAWVQRKMCGMSAEGWRELKAEVVRRRKELAAARAKARLAYQAKYQRELRTRVKAATSASTDHQA